MCNISITWYRRKLSTTVAWVQMMERGNHSHEGEYARLCTMILDMRCVGVRISRLDGFREQVRLYDRKDSVHRRAYINREEAFQ